MMKISNIAEAGKSDAIYRLQAAAYRAEKKGDLARAQELRHRAEFLRSEK